MQKLRISYLGMATTLIEMAGQSFLANPHFSRRILLAERPDPPPPVSFSEPQAILISDLRYSHLDLLAFKYFSTRVPIVVPKGLGGFVEKYFPNPIIEIALWNYHREGEVEIHTVPVRFRGYRWFPLRNRAAAAFVLKSPRGAVYYAAGTGYSNVFREVASLFDIDAALLPLGTPRPRWHEKNQTLTPLQTVQAFQELQAKHLLPLDGKEEAREDLARMMKTKSLESKVHFLKSGEQFSPQTVR
jgi:L-ascorbate metabolism protein UlaG (beta-lactamase superfamily)